jgi:hypothetical protein
MLYFSRDGTISNEIGECGYYSFFLLSSPPFSLSSRSKVKVQRFTPNTKN